MPAWKPPDWAFGPVWTTIFVLAVLSAAIAWGLRRQARRSFSSSRSLFECAALNILWNVLFRDAPDGLGADRDRCSLALDPGAGSGAMADLGHREPAAHALPDLGQHRLGADGAIVRLNAPFARTA